MREILFRGRRVDNGEWVEGGFTLDAALDPRITVIDSSGHGLNFIKVNPESVGQFTGLLDKNWKRIFEGDIDKNGGVVEYFDKLNWDGGGSSHSGFYCKSWFDHMEYQELSYHCGFDNFEIIGNIHDNPSIEMGDSNNRIENGEDGWG